MAKKKEKKQRARYVAKDYGNETAVLPDAGPRSDLPGTYRISSKWRIGISILIVLQLLAVTAEPFRFFTSSTRGTSPAADPARNLLGPFIEFAYLNHGYFFFAPEPGPAHLIDCQFTQPDGKQATVRYPDRSAQWPRLLYHRHFMLTENIHQLWAPPVNQGLEAQVAAAQRRGENVEQDLRILTDWRAERARFELIRDSMTNYVAKRFGVDEVRMERLEHRLPSEDEVFRQRMRLNDKSLYVVLPDEEPDRGFPLEGSAEELGAQRGPLGQTENTPIRAEIVPVSPSSPKVGEIDAPTEIPMAPSVREEL